MSMQKLVECTCDECNVVDYFISKHAAVKNGWSQMKVKDGEMKSFCSIKCKTKFSFEREFKHD